MAKQEECQVTHKPNARSLGNSMAYRGTLSDLWEAECREFIEGNDQEKITPDRGASWAIRNDSTDVRNT